MKSSNLRLHNSGEVTVACWKEETEKYSDIQLTRAQSVLTRLYGIFSNACITAPSQHERGKGDTSWGAMGCTASCTGDERAANLLVISAVGHLRQLRVTGVRVLRGGGYLGDIHGHGAGERSGIGKEDGGGARSAAAVGNYRPNKHRRGTASRFRPLSRKTRKHCSACQKEETGKGSCWKLIKENQEGHGGSQITRRTLNFPERQRTKESQEGQ
ncbi:hypothetical protein NDU88_006104 [Pleurodeles waltl]|uniref:Uncharacterized protein n=1 Tax=Pleurodeles waltl TaxID=8319 RepID=A0AAV7SNM8_PLEWA|nr:hypothetical protein NDU88_006104 [Pleurodeles waltl]